MILMKIRSHSRYFFVTCLLFTFFSSCIFKTEEKDGHHVKTIVDGTVNVEPLHLTYYSFEIEDDYEDVYLFGFFEAWGGSNNDIIVKVVEIPGLKTIYDSGKVHADSFSLHLCDPGKYRIEYDNSFSLFSNKTVRTRVIFEYDKR